MHRLLSRCDQLVESSGLSARLAGGGTVTAGGVIGSGRALLAVLVWSRVGGTVTLILDDEHSARAAFADVGAAAPGSPRLLFDPAARGTPAALAGWQAGIIVASASSLARPAPLANVRADARLSVATGAELSIERLTDWLEENSYERVDLVTEPGEYAARGGIVDAFPEAAELPLRIEFAFDAVTSLRTFDPLLQRSRERQQAAELESLRPVESTDAPASSLLPAGAVVITEGARVPARLLIELSGEPGPDCELAAEPAGSFVGNIEQLRKTATGFAETFVVAASERQSVRLATVIGPGPAYLVGPLSAGFAVPTAGFAVFTEREIYGTPVHRPARHRFRGLPLDNVVSLRPGDYVVHIDYGVGRFEGTKRMSHGAFDKDYLVLVYAGDDRVYVPVENLGLLDRYSGSDEGDPRLDRLGGRSWLLAKAKAARASAEYAAELLELYARRAMARGIAFAPDNTWQAEIEASFPYEETPDQLRVLAEVKRDMERSQPMDRLVCGDVGYGKTEIALRAALKAVANLKQVAVLAPTTILCYQHYATFRRRLGRLPVRIEMLSRFAGPARQAAALKGLADGTIDIVVGTHQLLSSRVRFRDLGLVVIDEEQKFGVRQKERIRSLRSEVDILTLTATPIPRTLYMGMAGLRDVSQLNTAPAGRREIHTEVSTWNDDLIRDYVQREVDRGGQVFFVHNEIQSIDEVAARLNRILPGINLAIGHGQMTGRRLADIYLDFAAGEHQLLLSTAIIESGLDMPNVNTIIVNRADRFGLSDLHQLRGRVGRASEQAWALFLLPARQEVTHDARKRLSALLAYSRLGSGFKLALRDMEIRGVGNLLGMEQHGHVARVGFTLYTQMLKEAVAKLKGETVAVEPELKLDTSAFIPPGYIADSFERVAIYKRLLAVESEDELGELRAELADRFGALPPAVEPLFDIARVRVGCRRAGILKVTLKDGSSTVVGQERTSVVGGGLPGLLGWLDRAVQATDNNRPPGA